MSEEPTSRFASEIRAKTDRKLRAQAKPKQNLGFGLGMMGLVGWSVVVPTLLGTALGMWLDKNHPGPHPWTLALLVAGLAVGCLNAWHWISKEEQEMRDDGPV
jgi:ATP synthase protein I